MVTCANCGKENENTNYCDWKCHIEAAKKEGGAVHTPNNLPIRCIKHTGDMYEHEHGDHPDYKWPVKVEYIGPIGEDEIHDYELFGGKETDNHDKIRAMFTEDHALLYWDGTPGRGGCALTTYECQYFLWWMRDGSCLGGGGGGEKNRYFGKFRLNLASMAKPGSDTHAKDPEQEEDENDRQDDADDVPVDTEEPGEQLNDQRDQKQDQQ